MPKKSGELYTIGQMARLCDVSAKQLRHYDENNILSPAYRDSSTSYRYYTQKQVEEVLLIRELRMLGFSLDSIAELLNNRDLTNLKAELEKSVHQARTALKDAQYKYDQTVDALLRVTQAIEFTYKPPGTPLEGNIQLVNFAAREVVYTRYISYWNAKSLFINRRAELYAIADHYGLTITGPNMAIFHGGYMDQFDDSGTKSEGDLETCFTISQGGGHCPHVRALKAFTAVSSVFIGHYRNMKPCYVAMEQWALERGYQLAGTSLEEYIAGATMTRQEENYVTRLYLPLLGYEP